MDFCNYNLTHLKENPFSIYKLGGGALHEMAYHFGCELDEDPHEKTFVRLVDAVAPYIEPHKNIAHAEDLLGLDAVRIAANWLERSGAMQAVAGAFWSPAERSLPKMVDVVMWSGGIANWLLRCRNLTERLDPATVGRVVLPMGSRFMQASEHPLVASRERRKVHTTEYQFARNHILPILHRAGFEGAEVLPCDSVTGYEIWERAFRQSQELLDGSILSIGSAPSTVESAGKLREAARRVDRYFDQDGDQLFMMGDFFPVAHHGEDETTHQNPLSGIGYIARNALYLLRAVKL